MRFCIATIVLLFSSFSAATQPEQVYVRFDKPLYVVGEQIWYKAFFLNGEVESKLLHIDWFGPQGQLLLQQKLTIEAGSSFGDLTIPLDWVEGHYHFRAYTQSMLNYGDELIFSRDIAIYNDFEKEIEAEDFSFEEPEKCSGNLQFDLLSNRENYKKRARVEVQLKVKDESQSAVVADLSVAVTAMDLAPLLESTTICEAKAKYDAPVPATSSMNYQPEIKLTIRGRVNDPETGAAVQSKFLVVFIPEQQALINIESDRGRLF